MPIRGLRLCALLLLFVPTGGARADAPLGKFDVFVELPKDAPFVGEPLRLVLRSAVRARVANDRIVQPALTDFDWRQFGVDRSSEEFVDGFWMPSLTRILMIYPLRPGRLTIEPFKRRITYLTDEGDRAETEFASQPVTIEVRAREDVGQMAEFWLPATSLRIDDRWEPEPDRIQPGEAAKRTVTVEAEGLTADRLPPLPKFRAPGVITFAGPVERRTMITDHGPIARAVYQWKVAPATRAPAVAPAIRLPWFDISARVMREAEAPERRVAFIEAQQPPQTAPAGFLSGLVSPRPLIAAALAFISTAASACLFASSQGRGVSWRLRVKRRRLLRALRRAARKDDIVSFRRALQEVSNTDPAFYQRVARRRDIEPDLESIDAALFARESPSSATLAYAMQRVVRAFGDTTKGSSLDL